MKRDIIISNIIEKIECKNGSDLADVFEFEDKNAIK